MGYSAICLIGEVENNVETGKLRIFTAAKPEDVFKTAQMHNWREIVVHGVFWTPGSMYSEDLKRRVQEHLDPYHVRGSWYELTAVQIANVIRACAHDMKCDLFNDHQRWLRYEAAIDKAKKNRPLLAKGKEAAVAMATTIKPRPTAEVLPFGRTRK